MIHRMFSETQFIVSYINSFLTSTYESSFFPKTKTKKIKPTNYTSDLTSQHWFPVRSSLTWVSKRHLLLESDKDSLLVQKNKTKKKSGLTLLANLKRYFHIYGKKVLDRDFHVNSKFAEQKQSLKRERRIVAIISDLISRSGTPPRCPCST